MAFNRTLTRNITAVQTVRTSSVNGDVVIGLRITNTGAVPVKASARITAGGNDFYLVGGPTTATAGADIPVGGAMIVINGNIDKVVLVSGDTIRVDATANVDAICSVLEN